MENNQQLLALSPEPPEKWGPHYWYVIHTFAATYPEKPKELDRDIALRFIKLIPFILPCNVCTEHAFLYMKDHSYQFFDAVSCRRNLVHFLRVFHDYVNEQTGKRKLYKV